MSGTLLQSRHRRVIPCFRRPAQPDLRDFVDGMFREAGASGKWFPKQSLGTRVASRLWSSPGDRTGVLVGICCQVGVAAAIGFRSIYVGKRTRRFILEAPIDEM